MIAVGLQVTHMSRLCALI